MHMHTFAYRRDAERGNHYLCTISLVLTPEPGQASNRAVLHSIALARLSYINKNRSNAKTQSHCSMAKTRPTTGGGSRKEDTEEIPPLPNPPASASASASAASSRSQSQPGAFRVFPTPLDGLSSAASSGAVVEAAGVGSGGAGGGSRHERHGSSMSSHQQPSVEHHEHEAVITDAVAVPIASEVNDDVDFDMDDHQMVAEAEAAGAGEAETMTAADTVSTLGPPLLHYDPPSVGSESAHATTAPTLASGTNTASDVVVMDSDAIARHEQRLVDQAKEETKRELDDRHRASKRRMVLGGAVVVLVVAVVAIATAVAVTARGSTDGGGSNGASEATVGADGNANGNTKGGVQAQPDLFPGCVQQNVLVGDDLSSAALATVVGGGADSTMVDVIAALNWPHVSVEYLEQVNFPPRDEENIGNDTEETTTTTTTTTKIRRRQQKYEDISSIPSRSRRWNWKSGPSTWLISTEMVYPTWWSARRRWGRSTCTCRMPVTTTTIPILPSPLRDRSWPRSCPIWNPSVRPT